MRLVGIALVAGSAGLFSAGLTGATTIHPLPPAHLVKAKTKGHAKHHGSTTTTAPVSTTTTTTTLPQCGASRDPLDPTAAPPPTWSPAIC
ncbi:MAG: hypothetical protein ACRD6W_08610 [Nitrososphaerales archaeon]